MAQKWQAAVRDDPLTNGKSILKPLVQACEVLRNLLLMWALRMQFPMHLLWILRMQFPVHLVVFAHVGVLHVLPAEADRAAAAEGAVQIVLPQEVRHDLPGDDVAHVVSLRQL